MGFAIGLLAAGLIRQGAFLSGLLAVGASRLCEALDGAVARHAQPTDLGGFLDITLDFVFHASIPLAFAVIAAKRGLHHLAVPDKSFYFVASPTEGTETLAFFAACCLWRRRLAPNLRKNRSAQTPKAVAATAPRISAAGVPTGAKPVEA